MPTPADPLPENVAAALRLGRTLEAVNLLRAATGLGLKEAKDAIDRHGGSPAAKPRTVGAMLTLPFEVLAALRGGNKLEAIRLMREKGGLGLKEAKDAVEALEKDNSPAAGAGSPGEVPRSNVVTWLLVLVVAAAAIGYYFLRRAA